MDESRIQEWKNTYGRIFSVSVRGTDYVFRELTFAEYKEFSKLSQFSSADAEEAALKASLLYPEELDLDASPAGLVSSLVEEVLETSGLTNPKQAKVLMDEQREKAQEVLPLMKAFILSTISSYNDEELDDYTFYQLAEKVALAEQIIKVNQTAFGMDDNGLKFDLIDPEEEAAKEQEAAAKHTAQKKPGQAGYHDPIAERLRQALG